jgi:hypothetical protein
VAGGKNPSITLQQRLEWVEDVMSALGLLLCRQQIFHGSTYQEQTGEQYTWAGDGKLAVCGRHIGVRLIPECTGW